MQRRGPSGLQPQCFRRPRLEAQSPTCRHASELVSPSSPGHRRCRTARHGPLRSAGVGVGVRASTIVPVHHCAVRLRNEQHGPSLPDQRACAGRDSSARLRRTAGARQLRWRGEWSLHFVPRRDVAPTCAVNVAFEPFGVDDTVMSIEYPSCRQRNSTTSTTGGRSPSLRSCRAERRPERLWLELWRRREHRVAWCGNRDAVSTVGPKHIGRRRGVALGGLMRHHGTTHRVTIARFRIRRSAHAQRACTDH
jgi:hypothetical protein